MLETKGVFIPAGTLVKNGQLTKELLDALLNHKEIVTVKIKAHKK